MGTNNTQQVAWIAIGSFFSFVVGIVSPMILSRYFDKGDYGTYKQVMFVYNTLLGVFTLGLPKAYSYFLPKSPESQAKDIISKITRLFFMLGAVFSLLLFAGSSLFARLLNNPDLSLALKLFSTVPIMLLPTLGIEGIYATYRKTQYIAVYMVVTRVLIIACIVAPVIFFHGSYISAIIGFDIASIVTCIIALYMQYRPVRNYAHEKTTVTYRQIFAFAIPLLYATIWGTIISSANQFFISRYFGNEVFADFSNGFMEIPFVGMIFGGVAAVLLPAFSRMDHGEEMSEEVRLLWLSSLEKSAKIIFPMLIYGVFFSRILMTCMYGDLYSSSSIYFQIKNISGLFYIIPFAPILLSVGKTKEYANVHLIIAFCVVILEYLAVVIFNSSIAIAIVSELCQLLKIYLLMKVISQYACCKIIELIPTSCIVKLVIASVVSGCLSYFGLSYIEWNKFAILAASFILFVVIFYCTCWLMKISYKSIAESLLGDNFKKLINIIP